MPARAGRLRFDTNSDKDLESGRINCALKTKFSIKLTTHKIQQVNMDRIGLFSQPLISSYLADKARGFKDEIKQILESKNIDDLEDRIAATKKKFTISPLVLDFDNVSTEKIDMHGQPVADDADANAVLFYIPIRGDLKLLSVRPMELVNPTFGAALSKDNQELVFTLNVNDNDGKRMRQHFGSFEKSVKANVRNQRKDIVRFPKNRAVMN